MGAMCTTSNRGVDRGPRSCALTTSAHRAHCRHQSQGAISRSSRARPRLASERMPTMLIHTQRPPRTALLLQLDGTLPNLALMRLATHLREHNCDVHFKRMRSCTTLQDSLFAHWDDVYASAIFEKTRPLVEELKRVFPKAIIGGTGSGSAIRLEAIGVSGFEQDYSLYPRYAFSIGFTHRASRLRCPFCVVPWKEGKVNPAQSIYEIW